jgi:ABC-type amino acid transport substrate-binding protein
MTGGHDRLERVLSDGPPEEAGYRSIDMGEVIARRPRAGVRQRIEVPSLIPLALIAALVVVVARSWQPVPQPPAGLPASILAAGSIRIVVPMEAPQVATGDPYRGFDLDVARSLEPDLGVSVEAYVASADEIRRGGWSDRWDVAIGVPPGAEPDSASVMTGTASYWRSAALYVPSGSVVRVSADLVGRTVCVLPGSLGAAWLDGSLRVATGRAATPPAGASRVIRDLPGDCIAAVVEGAADAFVVDWDFAFGAPPDGLVVAELVPFVVGATTVADGARPDAGRILAAVDAAIEARRTDGTLGTLARHRFGADLTMLRTD